MPPRIVGGNEIGQSPRAWYDSLPPVTRAFATASFVMALGAYLGVLPPMKVALLWGRVFKNFEIWRPITSCFFIAGFSMKLVIELLWLLQYGVQLEKDVYATQPADYVFMLLFGAAVLQLADTFVPFVDLYVFGSPLVYMIMYVWARFNPDVPLKIMGIVPIMSFYLPFAMLAVDILFGASPIPGGCGIMVGHLWWFLTDLYPRTGGQEVLRTPMFLKRLMAQWQLAPPPAEMAGQPAGFRAFGGRGQRLNG